MSRDELVKKLKKVVVSKNQDSFETIADFIISDRKKAVEPFIDLVKKLELIHSDKKYEAVWINYHIHGGVYIGPKYDMELIKAKKTLKNAGVEI